MASTDLKLSLEKIYQSALKAVDPEQAVKTFLNRDKNTLIADNRPYCIKDRKIFLVGAGKAGIPMARAVEEILAEHLSSGIIVVPYHHKGQLKKTTILEAGHPEPDNQGLQAGQEIVNFVNSTLTPKDLLLLVFSGGGSALLPAPSNKISLENKRKLTELLIKSGAEIQEINTIRKHLSRIKGGQLLNYTKGAQVIALLLSDIIGNDIPTIASGPTAADPTTFTDCIKIIKKYSIEKNIPKPIWNHLNEGVIKKNNVIETPKPGDPCFKQVQHVIVGSNVLALEAAAHKAKQLGFSPMILSSSIAGDTSLAASMHVAIANEILHENHPLSAPCCLISGGETTVHVTGNGKGGRNQEFVLHCAQQIQNWKSSQVLFASMGSDGIDGPTDAAGAFASPDTAHRAQLKSLSINDYLNRNDSYHFFSQLQDLIVTGPTQTNVMDLRFVLITKP